jgi:cell division protein FtsB
MKKRRDKAFEENFKEKTKIWGKYAAIFILLLLAFSFVKNVVKMRGVKTRIESERLEVEKLKRENEELAKNLTKVKSQEYVEKQLRDKLGLAKEGETVVVLPDEDILRKLAPSLPVEEDYLPDPTWKKWLKLFSQ